MSKTRQRRIQEACPVCGASAGEVCIRNVGELTHEVGTRNDPVLQTLDGMPHRVPLEGEPVMVRASYHAGFVDLDADRRRMGEARRRMETALGRCMCSECAAKREAEIEARWGKP